MKYSVFRISSDGTKENTVEFNTRGQTGLYLEEWIPKVAELKGGGIWYDNPLSDGRTPTFGVLSNIIEVPVIGIAVSGNDSDAMAIIMRRLRRLLKQSFEFFTMPEVTESVYLEVRANGETNSRYAVINYGSVPNDRDYFKRPFISDNGKSVMNGIQMTFERGDWVEAQPGTGVAVKTGYDMVYKTFTTGISTPTTDPIVFASNHQKDTNITDIYTYDASLAAWSANLQGTVGAYELLPSPMGVGDFVIFGINNTGTYATPFTSLVFDLARAGVDYTAVWEYSTVGPAFTAFAPGDRADQSNTLQPASTGVTSFHNNPPSNWVEFNLFTFLAGPAVSGFWVRLRVPALGAGPTPPRQDGTRNVYTVSWPFIEINEDEVDCDLPPNAKMTITTESDESVAADMDSHFNRAIIGRRTMSRGASFVSHLNLSDQGNPSGVTVTAGTNAAFVAGADFPTGRNLRYTPIASPEGLVVRATVDLDDTLAPSMEGRFLVFLRVDDGFPASTSVQLGMTLGTYGVEKLFDTIAIASDTIFMGEIFIPKTENDPYDRIQLTIRQDNNFAGLTPTDYIDLVLIPSDEKVIDTSALDEDAQIGYPTALPTGNREYLEVNSLDLIENVRARAKRHTDDLVAANYRAKLGGRLQNKEKETHRWIILTIDMIADLPHSYFDWSGIWTVEQMRRFNALRGNA